MPTYKLTYWDARALAEVSRQLFALSETPFEDNRITRANGKVITRRIPILEVDGKKLPQSHAIARYLARKFGYAGKTPFEKAWVDAIADQFKDFYAEQMSYFVVLVGIKEGDLANLRVEVGEPARDKFFGALENIAKKNGSGFLVGKSVTWVDLLVVDHMFTLESKAPGYLAAFPTLNQLKNNVQPTPKLKEYLAKRPNNSL